MKKALNILFAMFLLSGTMLFAANEVKVEVSVSDLDAQAGNYPYSSSADDLFDVQFDWPVGVGGGEAGIETDGNYIYTTKWNGTVFYKYEMDGTYIEEFSVTGCPGSIRDLAYDGQYFYGAAADNTVYEMDFDSQTVISTINAPIAVRAIAYDADADGFWGNNWSDQITLFDRSGSTLDSFACGVYSSYYGFAWENVLPDGPYLWGYAQDGATLNELVQIEIATGLETGVTFDVASVTSATGSAGGLCISDEFVAGKWTICGTSQNINIWGLELADSAPLDAPGAPTSVTVVPDVGGALEVDIDWICPDVQVNGDPLTELTEMEVYRDDALIYTDSSPTIGGAGSYTDAAVPASDTYTYKVVGVNTAGQGLPVTISTWVGEDVPNVVEDLLLEQTAPGVLAGTLTWVNPTTGLNGGAFNEPVLGYHIERNDGAMFEVTGLVTEYIDNTIPAAGVYSYTVQPYNSVGDGGIAESNAVLIADAGLLVMEDFATTVPPAGWEVIGMNPGNWSQQATSNAGGTSPEARFSWSPSFTGFSALTTMPLNTTGAATIHIEYQHFLNDFSGSGYTIGVKTTSDGGTTWNDAFSWAPTGDIGPELVVEDISTPDVGSATCQVGFFFDGYSFDLDYYYIDDVMISMPAADPGTIEGTVTLDGGTGNVEDVEVTAAGIMVNPDANGDYEITITPGTYDVTATLAGYEDALVENVVVEEGVATTGVDFNLVYIPITFDPPVNLAVDDNNMFTWEAPGGGDIEELIYDSGISTGAYSYVGYSMGVQMSPASACQILELKIHTSDGTEFNAEVWGWDAGAPTEDLYYQELATAAVDDWVIVDVAGENLMMDGDFVVAFGSINADTYMSYDGNDNNGRAWDHADAGGWASWTETYFCRAVVQYADGTIAELAPTPIEPANHATVASEKVSIDVVAHNVDTSRELESYDVYLDGVSLGNTTDLFWQFTDLVDGQEYEAGVVAVYTDGVSDMVTILFNANSDANNNTIGIATALTGNYPNPFNPVTNIAYSIQETGNVTLEVYNLRGQLVRTLVNDVQEAGEHTKTWNGTDDTGKSVASGVYFYKMKASNYTATKKMILMK